MQYAEVCTQCRVLHLPEAACCARCNEQLHVLSSCLPAHCAIPCLCLHHEWQGLPRFEV